MTLVSGYGYGLLTVTVFMTMTFSCISFSLESILSSLLMVIKCLFYCVFFEYISVFSCWSVWFCVWNLLVLMCFCFCWSLGCALDCCPLSRHCPLDPKAVWLPLQATVPMATFHSHLFSIWLWHIHINIDKENAKTPALTDWKNVKYSKILAEVNF